MFSVEGRIEDGIRNGFLAIDNKMKLDDEMKDDMSGTTAVVVIIRDNKIYCGQFFCFPFRNLSFSPVYNFSFFNSWSFYFNHI